MQKENDDSALKDDFLAAYHSILFSQTKETDIDVLRRRVALKFLTARQCESDDVAAMLLRQGLRQYTAAFERTELLKSESCPVNEDRKNWKSSLRDVDEALSLVKPLPCQRTVSEKACGSRELVDQDVENLMRNTDDEPPRKLSIPQASRVASTARIGNPGFSRQIDQDHVSDYRANKSPRNSKKLSVEHDLGQLPPSRIPHSEYSNIGKVQNKNRWKKFEEEARDRDERPKLVFRSGQEELRVQQEQRKTGKKTLGGRTTANSQYVCPFKRDKENVEENAAKEEPVDERLKGIDEKLIELIKNEIMEVGALVTWDDVAGLEHAKKTIKEIIVLPMLRPDIFTGLRRPPKGVLLFGPPGTGKTLIGKCIASQSKSTFFSISASSLTSKWIGEGEKMVRALFSVARIYQPAVIFIDEIDSLLSQRSETEHESSRRMKTEFLVQLDGAATGAEDRILVIGATNRPQELDEAARRRFVKRLYVPLPEFQARRQIVENLLASERHELNTRDVEKIAELTDHYSGADMTNLCKEASMGPIRSVPFETLENIKPEDIRCVTTEDFMQAITYVRPSVSQSDLGAYIVWDRTYGSGTATATAQ